MTSTQQITRYSIQGAGGSWDVVDQDGNVLVTVASRSQARGVVKEMKEADQAQADGWQDGTDAPPESFDGPAEQPETCAVCSEPIVRTEDGGYGHADPSLDGHPTDGDPDEPGPAAEQEPSPEPTQVPEPAQPTESAPATGVTTATMQALADGGFTAPVTSAAKHERVTLARVQVGDRLMTNLVTEGTGVVYAAPYRKSDGQVREVAEVSTRKAGDGEMPGTLYTLVFTDGAVSEERYGTTSHYRAEVFELPKGHPADEGVERVLDVTTVPAPKPAKQPKAPKADKPDKVPAAATRAGKLVEGDRLVLRDVGVVKVTGISKTGGGRLEVAYEQADGEASVREMWSSTNVRVAV